LRRAKPAFATIFSACLAATYLVAAVRLDQASAAGMSAPISATSATWPRMSPAAEAAMVGEAACYGAELAGRPTASGEIFDPGLLTAAHRTLPLGSQVQVTNLKNGLSTVVRINDRGPYSGDSIIDLSTAAAQRIGLFPRGGGRVQLERVR
jgi:rare lipoprotein A